MGGRFVICVIASGLVLSACGRPVDGPSPRPHHLASLKDAAPPGRARLPKGPRKVARLLRPPQPARNAARPTISATPEFLKRLRPEACRPELTVQQFRAVLRDYMVEAGPCDCRKQRNAYGHQCGDTSAEVRARGRVHLCWDRDIAIILKEDGGPYCPGRQTLFVRPGTPRVPALEERVAQHQRN